MEATHLHEHHHSHDHEHEHSHNNTATRQQWAKTLVLLGMGSYFAYTIVSGNLSNYINVAFAWLSYLAAGLFLILGAISASRLLRNQNHTEHDHAHEHDDHDHTHGELSWSVLAIVALPLLLGTVIPSNSLPPEAAQGNISTKGITSVSAAAAFKKPPLERNVLDWLREFNQNPLAGAYDNEPADVVGFVYREPNFGENIFMVARYTISCCVSDASAIGLPVAYSGDLATLDGQWVRVQGNFAAGMFRDEKLPILQATSVEQIDEPEHPYLYP